VGFWGGRALSARCRRCPSPNAEAALRRRNVERVSQGFPAEGRAANRGVSAAGTRGAAFRSGHSGQALVGGDVELG
jgi:hypothetical protein